MRSSVLCLVSPGFCTSVAWHPSLFWQPDVGGPNAGRASWGSSRSGTASLSPSRPSMELLGPFALLLAAWSCCGSSSPPTFRHQLVQGSSRRSSCKPLPSSMGLCRGIGYSEMRLPNLLGHDSMREALQQAASWVPLLAKQCHRDTKKFLCSLFAPVCLGELEEPIFPCRSLCEAVRGGCTPVMATFGFPWPEMLDCSRFPQGNELCIPPAGPEDRPELPAEGERLGGGVISERWVGASCRGFSLQCPHTRSVRPS